MGRTQAKVDRDVRPKLCTIAREIGEWDCSNLAHIRHTKTDQNCDFLRCFESFPLIPTRLWPRKGGRVDWRQSLFRLARYTSTCRGEHELNRINERQSLLPSVDNYFRLLGEMECCSGSDGLSSSLHERSWLRGLPIQPQRRRCADSVCPFYRIDRGTGVGVGGDWIL
jgi:hypothetical protein